jgi:hypothetical protein
MLPLPDGVIKRSTSQTINPYIRATANCLAQIVDGFNEKFRVHVMKVGAGDTAHEWRNGPAFSPPRRLALRSGLSMSRRKNDEPIEVCGHRDITMNIAPRCPVFV